MSSKLKNCPFCGGKATHIEKYCTKGDGTYTAKPYWIIICNHKEDCILNIDRIFLEFQEKELIKKWNKRTVT